jgi:hypothetical protein
MAIYQKQMPTGCRLADSIVVDDEPLTADQETAWYRLRLFLQSLDHDEVEAFLLFSTASIHMPNGGLKVSFNHLSGALRRPIAHTCPNSIELSVTYFSCHEFKCKMKAVLSNPLCFQMTLT